MHITFDSYINPPSNARHFRKSDGKIYNSLVTDLPLGFMSMSAYLKKYINVDIKLIDFNVELNLADEFPFENFEDYCQYFLSGYDYEPDIIGISSLFSPSFHNFIDVAKVSRRIYPDALILGGGIFLQACIIIYIQNLIVTFLMLFAMARGRYLCWGL